VQGFAYTLGLTTLIDVVVVFLFTHPTLALLARTKFFGEGHRWSGLDPERLGVTARRRRTTPSGAPVPATAGATAGAGAASSVSPAASPSPAARARSGDTIAARRAAARKATQSDAAQSDAAESGEDA
jgi:preprotein translocase subunit SecD